MEGGQIMSDSKDKGMSAGSAGMIVFIAAIFFGSLIGWIGRDYVGGDCSPPVCACTCECSPGETVGYLVRDLVYLGILEDQGGAGRARLFGISKRIERIMKPLEIYTRRKK